MYEYINKHKLQKLIIKTCIFLIIGLINFFIEDKNFYIIIALSTALFIGLQEAIKKTGMAHFNQYLLYGYIIIDILLILFSRLNKMYFSMHLIFIIIFLFFIIKAEGIKGFMRGGLLLLVINLSKIVYITFLI